MRPHGLHLRVAARHERAHAAVDENSIQVILADGGTITSADVQRLVQDRTGRLVGLRFHALELGPVVRWEALREDGDIVVGRLVLHSMVGGNEVVVWAELSIDGEPGMNRTAAKDGRDEQLAEIAYMGRDLIRVVREAPATPVALIIGEVVGIVDAAEREDRGQLGL